MNQGIFLYFSLLSSKKKKNRLDFFFSLLRDRGQKDSAEEKLVDDLLHINLFCFLFQF